MDARQSVKINMYRAVEGTCDAHQSAWQSLPFFAAAKSQLSTNITNITAAIALQGTGTEGATAQKEIYRNALEQDLLRLAAAVRLASLQANNSKGAKEATLTPSGVDDLSDNALLGLATRILGASGTLGGAALLPFGIDATFLTAFGPRIDAFRLSIDDPRHAQSEQVRGTTELARLIAATDALLEERLDPATELIKSGQPGFYTEYWASREIEDEATDTRALEVSVTDQKTGAPLANVSAMIKPGDIGKMTGPAGRFYVQSLVPGGYSIRLTRGGYQNADVEVTILAGERTRMAVSMKPLG